MPPYKGYPPSPLLFSACYIEGSLAAANVRHSSGFIFPRAAKSPPPPPPPPPPRRRGGRPSDGFDCLPSPCGRRFRRLSPRSGSCLRPSPPSYLVRSFARCRRLRLKSVLEVDGGGDGNATNDTAARTSSAFYSISGNRNHRRRHRTFPNRTTKYSRKGPYRAPRKNRSKSATAILLMPVNI